MNHGFNVEVAKKYGISEAIILENIVFWTLKNKANNKNFFDGDYWTYNSQRAFSELFPYLNRFKIQRTLAKLKKEGLIKVGNYNKVAYDRTSWYAVTETAMKYYELPYELPNVKKQTIHCAELNNERCKNEQPIPDINADINTKKEIYKEKPHSLKLKIKEKMETECKEWLEYYNKRCGSVYRSCKPILNNFSYWRDVYKMDELKIVIHLAQDDDWFKNKMTPMLLLRTRNKNGDCDYIGELLEKYKGHYEL